MAINYTGTPTSAGSRISDVNELSTLKETDIARVGQDIYRRDLAKEQEFAKTWEGGRGTEESETAFRTGVYAPPEAKVDDITDQPTSSAVGDVNAQVDLDEGSAGVIQNAFIESAKADIDSQKQNLFDIFTKQQEESKAEMERLQGEIDAMSAKQEEAVKATDPTQQAFYDETQELTRNRLETARIASETQAENFMFIQNAMSELDSITASVQANIQAEEGRPGLRSVKTANIDRAREKGIGRVGVIQAAIAARSDQLNRADTLIDNAFNAVDAVRQDSLDYYKRLQDFYSGKESDLKDILSDVSEEEKDAVNNQVTMIENELIESENAKDEIKDIILNDPIKAQLAGINLTDSTEEIAAKMAKYSEVYGGVQELREDYPDAGIKLTDTYEQATAKLSNSAIYRKGVRIPSSGGGSGKTISESLAAKLGDLSLVGQPISLLWGRDDLNIDAPLTDEEKAYEKRGSDLRIRLATDDISWEDAYNTVIGATPAAGDRISDEDRAELGVSDTTETWADVLLDKDKYYNK